MSATLPKSDMAHVHANVIWSRGGGSFGRLVWKELNEAIGIWSVIAVATLCSAALIDPRPIAIVSMPAVWLHAAPALFAWLYGSRAFSQEIAGGTWELLKSVSASAVQVVGSKWLVGVIGSVLMMGLSIVLAITLRLPLLIGTLGELTLWYLLVVLLTLAVSLLISQWSRSVWKAMACSGVICLAMWYLWATWLDQFGWLTSQYRWQCSVLLSLVTVQIPVILGVQIWAARWTLIDRTGQDGSHRWWRVFWRMAWKEMLAARDFWLAVLGIVALLDGLAWSVLRDVQARDSTMIGIGVMMSILHALGCGAISFAIEREDGTHDWLRRISAPSEAVFAAKFVVCQASIVTLTSAVILATRFLVQADYRLNAAQGFGLLLAVTLTGVISLGASTLTRRVLPAVFFAFFGFAAMVVLSYTLAAMAIVATQRDRSSLFGLEGILPWWLLVGSLLLALDCWLAERWLHEKPWWKKVWRGDPAKKLKVRRDVAWFERSPCPEMRAFGRLLWREWMEARVWLWVMPIAFAPWLAFEVGEYDQSYSRFRSSFSHGLFMLGTMPVLATLSIMLTMLPTLWGVWSVHHDQRLGLFRFLSDRGGSPTGIWLSKHLVWLPQVLLLALIAGTSLGLQLHWTKQSEFWLYVGFALVGALQGYAAGQWIAQLVRSPLTSLFLAGVLSLLLAGWSRLLWEIHAPWPYQLVPAATLLFANWVHARDWLEERWTWRAWLKIVVAVLLPASELVLALELQGYPLWKTLRDWPAFR